MADIRLKKITVEPGQSPLIVQNGDVRLTSTTSSYSLVTGALLIDGGVGISSSSDSTSATAGGSVTVGGGVGIVKTLQIGKNLVLDSSNGWFEIKGLGERRFFVDTVTNAKMHFAPDGVNKRLELTDTMLTINITAPSVNSSTGGLVTLGGISVKATENATSVSFGGSITTDGGVGIKKRLFVGEGISSNFGNTIGNLFTTAGNIGIGTTAPNTPLSITPTTIEAKVTLWDNGDANNHSGLGISSNQLNYHVIDATSKHVFYAGGKNGNGVELLRLEGGGNIGINTSTPQYKLDVNGTLRNNSFAALVFNSNTLGNLFTTGGNVGIGTVAPVERLELQNGGMAVRNTGNSYLLLDGGINGQTGNQTSYLEFRIDGVSKSRIMVDENVVGTPLQINSTTVQDVHIVTGGGKVGVGMTPSYRLDVNGDLRVTNGSLLATGNSNTLGNLFTTGGNVGIGTVSPASKLEVVNGNVSIKSVSSQIQLANQVSGVKYPFCLLAPTFILQFLHRVPGK
jgi:hypothetical protein